MNSPENAERIKLAGSDRASSQMVKSQLRAGRNVTTCGNFSTDCGNVALASVLARNGLAHVTRRRIAVIDGNAAMATA